MRPSTASPALPWVMALALGACGDDVGGTGGGTSSGGGSGGSGDGGAATTTTDAATTSGSTSDASSSASSTSTGSGVACGGDGYTETDATAYGDGDIHFYTAYDFTAEPFHYLTLEWWEGRLMLGTDTISGADYAACTLCVILLRDCAEGSSDPDDCTAYLATSGTVEVTSMEGTLSGRLVDAVLAEVTISEDLTHSDWVPDGRTWCIDELPFSAPLEELDPPT